ncbi:trigger factor [Taibaiella chishuiensis]|uniref:Trigger factor n=1 Tax=Taibaiella chishuiensis TaxID=1434707 RepID=A0A2P8D9K1_9BACT|nr:trigger factor [Taibaiella chishuiensis]PSK93900.1 trigger factor [Taibaiella chishuiensis]
MATVTREPIGNLHDKLVVKLTKEDYLSSFETALKQYGKNANVPGFRKGNVPSGMIKKMYGQSVFVDEVLRSANRELENYLKENKPEIFAQPLAIESNDLKFDMNNPAEFDFAFEIGLKPDFEVTPLNKKGAITRYKIAVSDKLVNDEVENISRRAGKVENPETFEKDTDIVYASYEACDAEGNVAEGTAKTEDVVTIDQMPKTLGEQLRAKKAGETIVFKPVEVCTEEELADFMKSALRKDAADTEAANCYYLLTLTKIGRLIPRELNADFFAEAFPNADVTDEAAFRERVKQELEKETERIAKERIQNELFETLVHETPIELPVTFLKAWMKKGGEQVKSDEEVEKEFPSFDHQLRWTLISDKLVRENEIQVSYDEVMEDIKAKVMAYFGLQSADDAPWMDSYMEKMAKEEKTIDETYRRLLFDKLFDKLENVMEVKKEEISEEEFSKLAPAHHHHH